VEEPPVKSKKGAAGLEFNKEHAQCFFTLFLKLKMKLKGERFETVSDIQRESQAVLDSIKKNDFHGAFEA
jgi:hypothetical protein